MIEYLRLLHGVLASRERGDGQAADALLDRMDRVWDSLSSLESRWIDLISQSVARNALTSNQLADLFPQLFSAGSLLEDALIVAPHTIPFTVTTIPRGGRTATPIVAFRMFNILSAGAANA